LQGSLEYINSCSASFEKFEGTEEIVDLDKVDGNDELKIVGFHEYFGMSLL
jgi:hypothetical protein